MSLLSSKRKKKDTNANASFIITLSIMRKREVNWFYLSETREGELTGALLYKHGCGKTINFESVAYINGVTQFLVCGCRWHAVCVDDRWCSVCRPISHSI